MSSHPTQDNSTSMQAFMAARSKSQAMTVLQAPISNDAGARKSYDVCFAQKDHQMLFSDQSGGAAPPVDYQTIATWIAAHNGHALTHCGHVQGARGIADVWFCQNDKRFCFDDQT